MGLFPKIGFMLAETWKEGGLKGTWAFEPKVDGERAAVIFDAEGNGTIISRSGRPKTNCEHIVDEISLACNESSIVFDGELYGASWGDVGASRGKKKSKKKLHYKLFDVLSLEDWKRRKNKQFYEDRHVRLNELYLGGDEPDYDKDDKVNDGDYVHFIPQEIIEDPTEKQILRKKKEYLAAGYEGLMMKRMKSLYLFKRDGDWLKVKFRESADLKVVDATEGKDKYKGNGIGALILEGRIDKVKVRTKVGQGFSDSVRRKLYQMWKAKKLKGLIVEIEHYGLTDAIRSVESSKSTHNVGSKLSAVRNGIFKRIRLDKTER